MSTPAAKDLLAQADRMMRQRVPEELPVLTDLIVEEIEIGDAGASPASRPADTARTQPARAIPAAPAVAATRQSVPPVVAPAAAAVSGGVAGVVSAPRAGLPPASRDSVSHTPIATPPNTATGASAREQFNALLISRLEEMRHSVYSQVMQQLELHAAGSLKTHLRESLTAALADIARDIADQVAEDTSTQVRDVVSRAVDAEIARLREQLSKRR